ncbi:uncharacterized protein TM35_000331430 [Trypanosoma theileri]|uniref:Uncharacterized protein n=1 Tax=Trypanosoma theileri TaxID=67003 RepID=A0A1X0NLU4_9TRYP|nr:uncharacterized protein TM35_000331430 [Trypanosoma theileri]ORC85686.1 hypothetical protein TM35_000331430 [Trypanosoma theileri]
MSSGCMGVDVTVEEGNVLTESDDGSSNNNNNNNKNNNNVEVGGDEMDLQSSEEHYLKDVELAFHVSTDKPLKRLPCPLEKNLQQEQQREEKAKEETKPESGLESEGSSEYYRQILFQRGEELLQAGTHFDRCVEEAEKQLDQLKQSLDPRMVSFRKEGDHQLGLQQPSLHFIRDRYSFCEAEVEPEPQQPEVIPAHSDLSSTSTNSIAAMVTVADVPLNRASPDFYKKLLMSRDDELQKAKKEFERYTAELAKHFKKPPVVLPDHLKNCFTGENVIVARDHKGRMDIPTHSLNESKDPSRHDDEVGGTLVSLHTQLENSVCRKTSWQIQGEQQEQMAVDNNDVEPPPRFTVVSLPNGDVRECDALAGRAYWDAAEPVDAPRVVPSQLLDERIVEAYHNYRYYSRRWQALLVDLANAIGGEDGAELLRRYEQREESLPLSPRCQRAFYESVVDYDELLLQQETIMEAVERDLEEFHARLLDSPVVNM